MALNPEKDGWQLIGNRPRRLFNEQGECRFSSEHALYMFITERACIDKDYRDLYNSLPWLSTDQIAANRQGWYLRVDRYGAYIRSANGYAMNDETAQQFVKDRAAQNDAVCIKALHILARARLRNA